MLNRLRSRARAAAYKCIAAARKLTPSASTRLSAMFNAGVAAVPVGVGMIYLPLGVITGGVTAAALALYLARGDS